MKTFSRGCPEAFQHAKLWTCRAGDNASGIVAIGLRLRHGGQSLWHLGTLPFVDDADMIRMAHPALYMINHISTICQHG